jgi:predicted MFS family arabinose efflux permease
MTEPLLIITERRGFLDAWQYHHYRLLWFSALGTNIGRWTETLVVSWLVLELTSSPFLVGLLGTCRFAPMFLGPFCGTIADRYDRRHILMTVQLTYAAASLIVMGLFFTSRLDVWHLFAFSLVGGLSYTFDFATRYATALDIVRSHHLVAAISLLLVATACTTIFGPLLGGSLLGLIGTGGCFALIAASFFGSYFMLLPMKISVSERVKTADSTWQNLVDGFHYVKNDRALLALIFLAALANLLLFPYWYTLMPMFARDIFNMGPTGFGQLMASIGLGYTIGSFAIGALPHTLNKGQLVIVTMTIWSVLLLIFATSRLFQLSMLLLVFVGAAQGMSMALIQSLLFLWSSEEMRGRISGVRAFAISTLPLGNLITGAGASLWGAPLMLVIISSASILITALIAIWATELRNRSKAFD